MSRALTWVLVGQLALSALLAVGLTFGLLFASEGRHGRGLHPLASVLEGGAALVVAAPLLLSLAWLGLQAAGRLARPAVVFVPLLATLGAFPLFVGLMAASESADAAAGARAERAAVAALRVRVGAGERDALCALVAKDPAASEAEQAGCLDVLQASAPDARRAALAPFLDRGFVAHFDPARRPVFAPAQQPRFVRLYLEAALAGPPPREPLEVVALIDCLRDVVTLGNWSPEARAEVVAQLPRLRALADALADPDAAALLRGALDEFARAG